MRRRRLLRSCLIALILGSSLGPLAGCGFQLRGSASLPSQMGRTHVALPPQTPLYRELRTLLAANGMALVERDQADAVLVIDRNDLRREVQSVGATARVREFVLRYLVTYQLENAAGAVLVAPRNLELLREYTFVQGQVLSAATDEEYLR
ncbi:MAG: LPS assembly lipoprotein LptE, partial [Pseudomonadota bacterium]